MGSTLTHVRYYLDDPVHLLVSCANHKFVHHYPISDSEWVSPIQVVPKKSGVTTIKNESVELIATRVQNSWRVCIDY